MGKSNLEAGFGDAVLQMSFQVERLKMSEGLLLHTQKLR